MRPHEVKYTGGPRDTGYHCENLILSVLHIHTYTQTHTEHVFQHVTLSPDTSQWSILSTRSVRLHPVQLITTFESTLHSHIWHYLPSLPFWWRQAAPPPHLTQSAVKIKPPRRGKTQSESFFPACVLFPLSNSPFNGALIESTTFHPCRCLLHRKALPPSLRTTTLQVSFLGRISVKICMAAGFTSLDQTVPCFAQISPPFSINYCVCACFLCVVRGSRGVRPIYGNAPDGRKCITETGREGPHKWGPKSYIACDCLVRSLWVDRCKFHFVPTSIDNLWLFPLSLLVAHAPVTERVSFARLIPFHAPLRGRRKWKKGRVRTYLCHL